jgi:hypothetical protein
MTKLLVPTLCVGTPVPTLCVRSGAVRQPGEAYDAERQYVGSHAERGNQVK